MPSSITVPDERLARQIAAHTVGVQPADVRRFPTGLMHYVYEATFDDHPPLAVRIAASYGHAAMRGAAQLSRLLRPRGIPLPAILAESLDGAFPYLVLERIPGTDLNDVVGDLPRDSLEGIAAAVVDAQRRTAGLPSSAGKYGYAVSSEAAPHPNWLQFLASRLKRLQEEIVAADRYDVGETEILAAVLTDMKGEINAVPATPFLHDTTTKNVIVTPEGRFSGIVDVDDLCFGDPRWAVALTHVALLAWGFRLDYTEAWMRLAGFSDDRLFRVYVALFFAGFMAERGAKFNRAEPTVDRESDQQSRRLYLDALAQL